jgi:heat shock protein HslJ
MKHAKNRLAIIRYIHLVLTIVFISGCTHIGQSSDTPLLDTTWNLSELFNEKIQHSGSKIPHLRFEAERVSGNDGCNNFFGSYTLDEDSLRFGMLASTRMACPHIEGFEMIFNTMLSITTRYLINGNKLELFDNDKLIASFLAAEQS